MWDIQKPKPVKLIVAMLAASPTVMDRARDVVEQALGELDLVSPMWNFTQTTYYQDEMGDRVQRQFVTVKDLIHPGRLAAIKHQTNQLEQNLADSLGLDLPRPVNLDPGIVEPSKLVLATTKNFSHRIYIGENMYAEVTLMFHKGQWVALPFTFPDYAGGGYFDFLSQVRLQVIEQLKQQRTVS